MRFSKWQTFNRESSFFLSCHDFSVLLVSSKQPRIAIKKYLKFFVMVSDLFKQICKGVILFFHNCFTCCTKFDSVLASAPHVQSRKMKSFSSLRKNFFKTIWSVMVWSVMYYILSFIMTNWTFQFCLFTFLNRLNLCLIFEVTESSKILHSNQIAEWF